MGALEMSFINIIIIIVVVVVNCSIKKRDSAALHEGERTAVKDKNDILNEKAHV